jgi:serine/threonine protein kinase
MSSASNNGGAGNIRYMAPERIDPASQDTRRTTACDVYGFAGVCLFVSLPLCLQSPRCLRIIQLHTGRHPFHDYQNPITISIQVINGQRPTRPVLEDCLCGMTDDIWQLIEGAWHQDPAARPSMLQLEERLRYIDTVGISGQQPSNRISCITLIPQELVELSIPDGSGYNHYPQTTTIRMQAALSHSLPDTNIRRLPCGASTSKDPSFRKPSAKKRMASDARFVRDRCEKGFTRPRSLMGNLNHHMGEQRE